MSDIDQLEGTPFYQETGKDKLPTTLKVLTILTFIGSGIGVISSIYGQVTMKANLEKMEKMQGSEELEKMPAFLKNMFSEDAMQQMRLSYENRVPILILTLVGIALCVYGAIQMRSLKKQGYALWMIGEILPLAGSIVFVGTGFLTSFSGYMFLGITALFILLYTLQLKHLK